MKNTKQIEALLVETKDIKQRDFLKKAIRILRLTCDGMFVTVNLEMLKKRLIEYEHQEELIWNFSTTSIKEKKEQNQIINRLYNPALLRQNIKILEFILE